MTQIATVAGRAQSAAADTTDVQHSKRARRCVRASLALAVFTLLSFSSVSARQYPVDRQQQQQQQQIGSDLYNSLSWSHSRRLRQASCPDSNTASNTCKSVDESDVDNWRNVLVSQCSTVTPPSAGQGGCCSELPTPGTAAWTNFVSCACSTLASEVDAFVSVPTVISTCNSGSITGITSGSYSGSPLSSPSSSSSSSPISFNPVSSSHPFSTSSPLQPSSSGRASQPPPPPSTVNLQSPPRPPASPSSPSGSISGGNGGLASLQDALSGSKSLYPSPSGLGNIPGSNTLASNTPASDTATSNTPDAPSGMGSDDTFEDQLIG
ncbi:TPA: hypothetical protein ACH3X1_008566 [Trebouxia sp. C0004]